jgi:transposase-like protein
LKQASSAELTTASRAYGIKCAVTECKWLRQYVRDDLIARRTSITTTDQQDETKELKKCVKELEKIPPIRFFAKHRLQNQTPL